MTGVRSREVSGQDRVSAPENLTHMSATIQSDLPAPRQRGRRSGRWLVALVLLVTVWGTAVWTCDYLADRGWENRRLLAADRWDRWATTLSFGRTNWFRRLTLDRKLGRFEALNSDSIRARLAGVPEQRITHELLLYSAQAGELDSPEATLSEIIRGDQIPGREIFEAFTNGAIANYQIEEANYLLDNWEQDYPTDPLPCLMRGRIAEHKNDWIESAAQYERALQLLPTYGPAAYNLARVKLGQAQLKEAETWYTRAAKDLELSHPAWVGLAHCHRLAGEYPLAEQLLERVLDADVVTRGMAYRLVGDTADSGRTSPLMERGELRLIQKEPAAAVADFEEALREQPHNSAIRFHLASALRAAGRAADSRREYEAVRIAREALKNLTPLLERVRANPDDPEPRATLGNLFLNYISERQGEAWLHSALRVAPDFQPAHAALALHYRKIIPQTPELKQLSRFHANAAGQ